LRYALKCPALLLKNCLINRETDKKIMGLSIISLRSVNLRSENLRLRLFKKKQQTPLFDPTIPLSMQRAALDTAGSKVLLGADQRIEPVLAGNVSGEWITSTANTGRKAVVLYVHGGAFVAGSCLSSRCMSVNLAKATDLPVLSLNYRLAPEYPFPAALEDVTAAYHWLLASGVQPQELIMVGDSAGGNLVLAALLLLRDAGDPLPAAAILLSPWIDLATTGRSFLSLADVDPYLTPPFMQIAARRYLGKVSPTLPLASPLYGDLRALPPMFIQVGSDEILIDDSIRLAQRINEVGGVVHLEVWQRMWHVWHYFVGAIPQGGCSFAQINAFIRAVIEQNSKTHQLLDRVGSDSFLLGLEQTQLLRC
jgi:monoterpene epsilon-lactone hydrolase